jgi:hypothetical protein
MIRTHIIPTTVFSLPRRSRTRIHRARKEDWTPDEQELINENKEWRWYLPEEDVWDLDSIREASGYQKESLEITLGLMTPEEEKLVSDMVEKLEEYVEKYIDGES